MFFIERYKQEKTWHGKVIIMEIYHLAMVLRNEKWTITKTAFDFQCSIGLVSENLKLADAIHSNESLTKCQTRQDALKKIGGSKYGRSMENKVSRDTEELD